jgi:hypothetical protein
MDERLGYMPGNGHALRFPKDPSEWFNGQTRGVDVNFEVDRFIHPSIYRSTVEPFYNLYSFYFTSYFARIDDYNFGRDVMEKIQMGFRPIQYEG